MPLFVTRDSPWQSFTSHFGRNLQAGFFVFLIALPLCMGIALASGFPPISGIITAIVGGLVTPWISNSELTIKGPAAGLIVVVLGCITELGYTGQNPAIDLDAYRLTLGVAVIAGVCQMLLGLLRAGILGDIFPASAVHGMLAAIGLTIMIKQLPIVFGESARGGPLQILAELPRYAQDINPAIALIGMSSLGVMIVWPMIGRSRLHKKIGKIPAPIVVLALAIAFALVFDLAHPHGYDFGGHHFAFTDKELVPQPSLMDGIVLPKFDALTSLVGWKWVLMLTLIGSLESILSAKAIDLLDPKKRATDMNRDLVAVGLGNTIASCLGGLPMISEIVRSKANIDSGADGRAANAMHAVFLLLAVAIFGVTLHYIPLAALSAMLVYTGYRLAHPREFIHAYETGREQFVIFVSTIVATLATDLLIGIATGVAMKVFFHIVRGVRPRDFLRPQIVTRLREDDTLEVEAHGHAIFTHWISMRRKMHGQGLLKKRNIVVDLSQAKLVDHTILSKLEEYRVEVGRQQLTLTVKGLETLQSTSAHPLAVRRGASLQRSPSLGGEVDG